MKEIQFIEVGNYKIAFEECRIENPRASILMVHGMGEHCWRYDHVVKVFNDLGLDVIRFDLPGHGRSSGKRGSIKRYDEVLDCVSHFLKVLDSWGKPKFLFGHSMGGNIVLGTLLFRKPDLKGAIVASPWVALSFKPGFLKSFLATMASKIVPNLVRKNQIDLNSISKDEEVVRAYADDDLIHDHISPRLFVEMSRVATLIQLRAQRTVMPSLLYHGTEDQITAFWATKLIAGKMKNARFVRFESGFHEMHNEPNKEEVFAAIGQFIEERLSA